MDSGLVNYRKYFSSCSYRLINFVHCITVLGIGENSSTHVDGLNRHMDGINMFLVGHRLIFARA